MPAGLLQRLLEDDESLLDSSDPKVDAVLIERLYQNSWATRYTPIPLLFGAFVIYRDYLAWWHIAGLTTLYLGTTLYMDRLRDAFAETHNAFDTRSAMRPDWGLRFAAGCALTGSTWGLLGWFAYPPGDFALQAALSVAWAGLATSTLNTRAVHLPSFYAFMIAMSAPFFARGFLFGEPSTVIMAFFGVILLASMCFCAQINNRRERISVVLRLRHAELIGELDRARAAAETSYREMEREYRVQAADFAAVQQLIGTGYWNWDATTGQIAWSDETYRLLGLPPQSCPAALAAWLDRVYPDDREAVRSHYHTLRHGAATGEVQFRLLDGKTRREAIAQAVTNEQGLLLRIRGILRAA